MRFVLENWPKRNIKSASYLRGRIGWQGLRADEFVEDGPFLVTGTDFLDGHVNWDTCYHVTDARFAEGSYIHLQDDDILITKDGTIGKIAYVSNCPQKAVLNSGIFLLRCSDGSYDHRFMYHLLRSHLFRDFLEDNLAGSTIKHLYQHIFERFDFPVPNIYEQHEISRYIDLLDRAISQTTELLEKQQRIKTGLMYELLTRGIDENGCVRSERTHEFANTPLGALPSTWKVLRVDQLLANVHPAMRSGPFGSALLKAELVDTGVPLLGIDNVYPERFVSDFTRFVTPVKAEELSRYKVRPGDVMITIMGTVGRSCVVPENIGVALSSKHVWTLTFDDNIYSPFLACLQFNYAPWVKRHFMRDEQGGVMSAIRSDTLRSTLFPVPPKDEIERIEHALQHITKSTIKSAKTVRKLKSLREGVMHDLLSGVRRVHISQKEEKRLAGVAG